MGSSILVHAGVHGRAHHDGGLGSQEGGAQQVIGQAIGHFGQDVGRGRSHNESVGPVGQGNMLHVEFLVAAPHGHSHLVTTNFFKSKRGHKLLGVLGHDHAHFAALLAQTADQIHSLIHGDTAGNP